MNKTTGALSISFLVVLLNTVAVLAALGTVLYTQVLFKRPPITETAERARLKTEAENRAKTPTLTGNFLMSFPQMTVNISGGDHGAQGKLHYTTMAFTFELRDEAAQAEVEAVKQQFLDRLIQSMSRKSFEAISNVHGRFLLRSEMMEMANELLQTPKVTNVYFTYFVVQ